MQIRGSTKNTETKSKRDTKKEEKGGKKGRESLDLENRPKMMFTVRRKCQEGFSKQVKGENREAGRKKLLSEDGSWSSQEKHVELN